MKSIRIVALAVAAAMTAVTAPARASDIESAARALVAHLVAGDFTAAGGDFDAAMRAAMPPDKLRALWRDIETRAGRFESIERTQVAPSGAYRMVFVTCAFERETMGIKIVFDADARVAGLFVGPAAPPRPPPWVAPAYADTSRFTERATVLESGGWKLPARLTLPVASGAAVPAVVLVHGSGPHDADETVGAVKPFRDLAWGLASRGVAVLRYDKRTLVLSQQESASVAGITVREETIDDAGAAVRLLARTPGIDAARIWVVGHSLGGMLAPWIAAQESHVAGIVVLAGNARPLEDLMVEQIRFLAARDGVVAAPESAQIRAVEDMRRQVRDPKLSATTTIQVLGTPVPGAYWLALRDYRPADAAAALGIPVHVFQGGRDYQVGRAD